jgi:hypothetical protein
VSQAETRPESVIHTFTRPCQSDIFALPVLRSPNIRGTFLMPFRWLCMALEDTRFSGLRKHATAFSRALITGREIDGRSNHVRMRDRPRVVFVLFKVPWSKKQLKDMTGSKSYIDTIE